MKKVYLVLFTIFFLSFCNAQDFTVTDYSVEIYVKQEGHFDVVEKYDLNFERAKHGIYRTIQTKYDLINSSGEKEQRKIKIRNIEVPGHKFDAPFNFVQKLNDRLTIKIGDADLTVIGPQHYEIKYTVENAFLFEDDYVRFYWNVKPDGWAANFNKITFKVHVPENIRLGDENFFVYSGERGTTSISSDFQTNYYSGTLEGTSRSDYVSYPGQSVTVMINMPPNSIAKINPVWPFWEKFGWLSIVTLLVIPFYYVFLKFGKDDKVISATSYYPPENLDPAMAGFMINDRDDNSDLIALIPHWGSRGLLEIEEIPKQGFFSSKDTKLTRLEVLPDDSPEYERTIFNGLFGGDDSSDEINRIDLEIRNKAKEAVKQFFGKDKIELKPGEVLVSSLQNSFYTTMNSARRKLKDRAQIYYEAKSKAVKNITLGVLIISGILFSILGLFIWGPIAVIAIVVTCIVLIIINTHMVKRNAKGNTMLSELKGFKNFIKLAEENKLKMLLKDDPGYFENTMGYALAFGMFDRWAKKFDALNLEPPKWYHSGVTNNRSMNHFSNSFASSMSNVRSNMVSSPSSSGGSSGGGSSGGGFGGGGGGSW